MFWTNSERKKELLMGGFETKIYFIFLIYTVHFQISKISWHIKLWYFWHQTFREKCIEALGVFTIEKRGNILDCHNTYTDGLIHSWYLFFCQNSRVIFYVIYRRILGIWIFKSVFLHKLVFLLVSSINIPIYIIMIFPGIHAMHARVYISSKLCAVLSLTVWWIWKIFRTNVKKRTKHLCVYVCIFFEYYFISGKSHHEAMSMTRKKKECNRKEK